MLPSCAGINWERGPTLENDLDMDPFAGSYITGEVCERLITAVTLPVHLSYQ